LADPRPSSPPPAAGIKRPPTDPVIAAARSAEPAIEAIDVNLWYGTFQALHDVNLRIKAGLVTAMIGPSGCGKSTLLRSCNRINERLGYVRTTGTIKVLGADVYGEGASQIQVRRRIGMVFQRPNPLPLSVRDNVLFGHRLHREESVSRADEDAMVEQALRQVLLWDRIKDHLSRKATSLSLEEQQKLCIARLLPTRPSVLLMDEPCSALDPAATAAVEELIWEVLDPDRHPQHGAGAPRQRRVRVHAHGQGRRAHGDRGDVRGAAAHRDVGLHRRPLRLTRHRSARQGRESSPYRLVSSSPR
jgi:phosphate transport system ATP-binding protein